ncbi:Protein CBG22878 [Caenorhabditis briggsae]|uniref:Protein CBG22862 n=1 Tax=Caenorhabditis briggsae TaxID=6238 RepID=G2J738_CAEBR|nr:Protein CBG22862 [Caenorhabditis briggsae]XP_002638317.1 Protein CBG22865 [Caenorhabditis briggsae]XP_002638328.1 Protein CBG22878 [Caenorhabditis briggsae]CAP39355.1 Protein CBG22862 [Caenorhabditis briggsae]CAP39358.1 Protein CBG22865 [Caenorhabditis briggsae]CAP39369.1 Protein CBG22878 [Caenorhabditis briggsae]
MFPSLIVLSVLAITVLAAPATKPIAESSNEIEDSEVKWDRYEPATFSPNPSFVEFFHLIGSRLLK